MGAFYCPPSRPEPLSSANRPSETSEGMQPSQATRPALAQAPCISADGAALSILNDMEADLIPRSATAALL